MDHGGIVVGMDTEEEEERDTDTPIGGANASVVIDAVVAVMMVVDINVIIDTVDNIMGMNRRQLLLLLRLVLLSRRLCFVSIIIFDLFGVFRQFCFSFIPSLPPRS